MRTSLAWAAPFVAVFSLLACSSNGSSSIVGEWQSVGEAGVGITVFFNGDGTCGFIESFGNTSTCQTDCRYSFNGTAITITQGDFDGGVSTSSTTDVTISGSSLTTESTDGGIGDEQYTRINSSSMNSCP